MLHEIVGRYRIAMNELDAMVDIDEDVVADTLNSIEGEFEQKAINVALFIENLEADALAIKDAEKRMKERREVMERKADRLREYLKNNFEQMGLKVIKHPLFDIKLANNPESVVIHNQDLLPKSYIAEKVTYAPDKAAIKAAIKSGISVSGAELVRKTRMDIK